MKNYEHEPAFPTTNEHTSDGLSRLEYFVCHCAFEPSKELIELEHTRDKNKNPHNDSYKPPIRGRDEIIAQLKIKNALSLLSELGHSVPLR